MSCQPDDRRYEPTYAPPANHAYELDALRAHERKPAADEGGGPDWCGLAKLGAFVGLVALAVVVLKKNKDDKE